MASSNASGNEKAFKRKSVVLFAAKITFAVVLVIALAGVGVRFLLPTQWNSGVAFAKEALDAPLLGAFETLSAKYIDGSDLDADGRKAWKERLKSLTTVLKESKGTAEQRDRLREIQEAIIGKMKDGRLDKADLDPHEKEIDSLLSEVEAVELKKGQ